MGAVSQDPSQKATSFWSQLRGEGSPAERNFVVVGGQERRWIWEQRAEPCFPGLGRGWPSSAL